MEINNCKLRSCAECIDKSPVFKLMTSKEIEQIEVTRTEVVFRPDEIIYKQGTKATQIVTITEGLAKIYIEGFDNKDLIIDLIKPITLISGPGIYTDSTHHFSLKAIEKTQCCFYSVDVFKEIAKNNSKISNAIIELISQHAISYLDKFIFLTQKQAVGKVAEILLLLYKKIYCINPMNLTVSYQDIAEMTSLTKDTVIRVLRNFTLEKVIEMEDTHIKIIDFDKLKVFSEMG
jgi:CRP/FNR family transcriptional regulator